jgi:hypothetical protein
MEGGNYRAFLRAEGAHQVAESVVDIEPIILTTNNIPTINTVA